LRLRRRTMIQVGTFLRVIDNSGAKLAYCIRVCGGFKRRAAKLGDTILIAINRLRKRRKRFSRVKRGSVLSALIVRTRRPLKYVFNDSISFFENTAVVLNRKNKLLGTRIFGLLPKALRFTRYMRSIILCKGVKS